MEETLLAVSPPSRSEHFVGGTSVKADRENKIETLVSVKAWCRWTVTSDSRHRGGTGRQRPFQEVGGVGRKRLLPGRFGKIC